MAPFAELDGHNFCPAVSTALVLSVEDPFWATMIRIAGGRSGAAGGVMIIGSNLGGDRLVCAGTGRCVHKGHTSQSPGHTHLSPIGD